MDIEPENNSEYLINQNLEENKQQNEANIVDDSFRSLMDEDDFNEIFNNV